jgi:hypothetical protein
MLSSVNASDVYAVLRQLGKIITSQNATYRTLPAREEIGRNTLGNSELRIHGASGNPEAHIDHIEPSSEN